MSKKHKKHKKLVPEIVSGTYISNARGFGFLEVEGREEDLFISEEYRNTAFHKDLVEAEILPGKSSGKRKEAKVLRVLERGTRQIVGTFERTKESYGFVIPDNVKLSTDLFVPVERSKGAVTGHKVVAEITDFGTANRSPEAKIVEILGHVNDPGVDILSIVKGLNIPTQFPEKVMNRLANVAEEVSEADIAFRRDLRDVLMITIDGEDAKDLDDAVSLSFDGSQYHLGVHIADVSNYVQENSAMDREALKRGTSVYLVDRVIPMLPHALSNGICSLNAGENRLALSCLMTVNPDGEIVDHELCESVICVDQRMSYTRVSQLFELAEEKAGEDVAPATEAEKAILPMIMQMRELAKALRARRRARGSIDFDFPECKVLVDREGRPTEIKAYVRNAATDIIEDFMLAANETVAEHFYWLEAPFVYRIHEVPDPDRIQKLKIFIANYGYYLKAMGKKVSKVSADEIHPKEIQKMLEKIEGTPEEAMIARLTLRSMRQARYDVECSGHFGLASQYYCHFTSPIRRYPDLQIHRIIKEQLRGKLKEERLDHYRAILPQVCKTSSETERRAEEAERDVIKLKKAEYMQMHIGEEFDGVISGVTNWGIYVELPNTVEGLVHVAKIPGDFFVFDEKNYEMVGQNTGKAYRLGMPVRVCIEDCDTFSRTIDMSLVEQV